MGRPKWAERELRAAEHRWPLVLPEKGSLPRTGDVDLVEDYYSPVLGRVLQARLRWALDCLPKQRSASVLEVGYGSGLLQPSLYPTADLVAGVDVHRYMRRWCATRSASGVCTPSFFDATPCRSRSAPAPSTSYCF